MASGDYIIPGAQSVSEWFSPIAGFIQGCGQAAELVVAGIASGKPPTPGDVTAAIKAGITNRQAGAHGSTTPSNLQWLAQQQGIRLTSGSGSNALATIRANLAKGLPTIVGVNNASAFGGSDSNVGGHWLTAVGQAANGNIIFADPNTKQATTGGFVQYTPQQVQRADPFSTLTPASLPTPNLGNAGNPIAGAATGVFGDLFNQFGVSPSDFAWRAGLIVGGFVLIVLGILVFFSHQAETVVETTGKVAASAAS